MPISLWDLAIERQKEQVAKKHTADLTVTDGDDATTKQVDAKPVDVSEKQRENSYVLLCGSKDCVSLSG
jgi:hypothetical protein